MQHAKLFGALFAYVNNIQALAGDDTITGGIDARNNIDGGADDDN